ncbi:hypothetical protein ACJU26_07030 [Acidithiobacillus sp. M4-SHS-6]|uniref:hypothetical protein n=1 Tax=Acidithiobacillus sp. M4-SHS-6 TaxID=3383024 RepID=UPI0039BE7D65
MNSVTPGFDDYGEYNQNGNVPVTVRGRCYFNWRGFFRRDVWAHVSLFVLMLSVLGTPVLRLKYSWNWIMWHWYAAPIAGAAAISAAVFVITAVFVIIQSMAGYE